MLKLLWLLILVVVTWRLVAGRWPWQRLRRARPDRAALDRARALLGVQPNAAHDVIIEAHKALIVRVHPDRGGTPDLVHEANAARDLLLAARALHGKE